MFKKTYAKLVGVSSAATAVLSLATATYAQVTLSFPTSSQYGFNDLPTALSGVLNLVFFFALILVLIYLIWGGIQWITSGGDKAGTEAARGKITGAIVGIIIVAVAFAIFRLLMTFVGATDNIVVSSPR